MRQLHVAVDAHDVPSDPRGIGVYVRALLTRMLAREDLRVTLLLRRAFPAFQRRALEAALQTDTFGIANRVPTGADIFWSPWNGTFFDPRGVRAVATIHDVAPFAFPASDPRERQKQQEPFLRSAQMPTRVITDSAFSRAEIVRHLHVDAERIDTIALAPDERYSPGAVNALPAGLAPRGYFLYVGANDQRKNLSTLLHAWRVAFPDRSIALVCVTPGLDANDARVLGNVSFEVLRDLYRGAIALAMPSLYEGFGIPPLEAMRCGSPVVCSRAASLPEVCGEAAYYVERPREAGEWCEALQRVAADVPLRERLARSGLWWSSRFSWDRCADETVRALYSVAVAN